MMNRLWSGPKAGIEREKRGKHTLIMLAIKMEAMAMSLRGTATDFLLQLFLLWIGIRLIVQQLVCEDGDEDEKDGDAFET